MKKIIYQFVLSFSLLIHLDSMGQFHISASGNIGIKNTQPTEALEVNGRINTHYLNADTIGKSYRDINLISDYYGNLHEIKFDPVQENGSTSFSKLTNHYLRYQLHVDYSNNANASFEPSPFGIYQKLFYEEDNNTGDYLRTPEVFGGAWGFYNDADNSKVDLIYFNRKTNIVTFGNKDSLPFNTLYIDRAYGRFGLGTAADRTNKLKVDGSILATKINLGPDGSNNQSAGIVTLSSGSAFVSYPGINSNSIILLTPQEAPGTNETFYVLKNTGFFSIKSTDAASTKKVAYLIIN